MNGKAITVVRIYLHESESLPQRLLDYLHDEAGVRGVTVFRGVTGFGASGKFHTARLLDLSLDLPVVIEFFDEEKTVADIIDHLEAMIKPGHMVYWQARVNDKED